MLEAVIVSNVGLQKVNIWHHMSKFTDPISSVYLLQFIKLAWNPKM